MLIGLGIFAYSRKIGPFEVRRGSPEIVAVLEGGYRKQQTFYTALQHVQTHPAVVAALGEPIMENGLQHYQLILQNAGERYDYVFDLEGPAGQGIAAVSVEDLAGRYRVVSASFTDEAGKTRDILAVN